MGYFSLVELEEFRGRFGLGIERDRWFKSKPLKKVADPAVQRWLGPYLEKAV